ncbi:molybdopterin molybdochelatase [Mucilaginibacter lappiensis]|uniref:Molybdopterin molybdenumtransferase n=1 Tax=Mucilaginibacter lappiensis TaxID=354630 RepID=A0ABR6PK63_9SPHI|nr:molybdopterin molybdotransferase MoeA [Mucilaginibacter lappiensis]MBB6109604.1 molybdopterin molybdotransferase [Mucilaginibacter lappiensis]SIR09123.1 molybdopterin molybdochelatase [Mucilaginibacter lappiensis]
MTTVEEAEKLILAQLRDYGTESLPFEQTVGRVLAEAIKADRDLPPFNRVTMDGIAVNYQSIVSGILSFNIKATQAAGDEPVAISHPEECIEIMTGAVLPVSVDTVIRYEDVEITSGLALVKVQDIKKGQNLHLQGVDKKEGDVLASIGQMVTPAIIGLAASVGKTHLLVKKLPRVVIISSGDELVEVDQTPAPYQIRKSNGYTIKAVLQKQGLQSDMIHIPDDPEITRQQIQHCLQNYDVLLLSGGISMGKFDYIPQALEDSAVKKIFHKVAQRPGKPFWFGVHANGNLVFAFPGNPVATFMCLYKYFLNWLRATLGTTEQSPVYAVLAKDFQFQPPLQYFLQVKLQSNPHGQLMAWPIEGNGSGDFANLADTDAFLELPLERTDFKAGEVFRVVKF